MLAVHFSFKSAPPFRLCSRILVLVGGGACIGNSHKDGHTLLCAVLVTRAGSKKTGKSLEFWSVMSSGCHSVSFLRQCCFSDFQLAALREPLFSEG